MGEVLEDLEVQAVTGEDDLRQQRSTAQDIVVEAEQTHRYGDAHRRLDRIRKNAVDRRARQREKLSEELDVLEET
ncbi:MAG: hypothetical protein ABEL76_08735, partial [Bradymonadaceae bacterium]